jgi:hypothetical protein
MCDQRETFMQTWKNSGARPRTGARMAMISVFGLVSACLNPDISDEAPLSERGAAALDAPDAGTSTVEEPSSVEPSPLRQPTRERRDGVSRGPVRR